jgi:hypothetical protein
MERGKKRLAVHEAPPERPPAVKSACVRGTEAGAAPESVWPGHFIACLLLQLLIVLLIFIAG